MAWLGIGTRIFSHAWHEGLGQGTRYRKKERKGYFGNKRKNYTPYAVLVENSLLSEWFLHKKVDTVSAFNWRSRLNTEPSGISSRARWKIVSSEVVHFFSLGKLFSTIFCQQYCFHLLSFLVSDAPGRRLLLLVFDHSVKLTFHGQKFDGLRTLLLPSVPIAKVLN